MKTELIKGGFHALAMVLSATMGSYNALRYAETKKPKHALYAVIYGAATCWEGYNTYDHWSSRAA